MKKINHLNNHFYDRKTLVIEAGQMLDAYCSGCFLKRFHRKEYGKKYAHSFCIRQCTVGEVLKKYGQHLS